MLGQIGSADETAARFDMQSHSAATERDVEQVTVFTTGNEHSRFTVMFASTMGSQNLLSFIIFNRKTLAEENFPLDVESIPGSREKVHRRGTDASWQRLVWNRQPRQFFCCSTCSCSSFFWAHLTSRLRAALMTAVPLWSSPLVAWHLHVIHSALFLISLLEIAYCKGTTSDSKGHLQAAGLAVVSGSFRHVGCFRMRQQ